MNKLPNVILNELKCADCKSYLSYIPVRVLPNGAGICGRCGDVRVAVRTTTYEALAFLFSFPCKYRYKNCPTYVPMQHLPQHEKWCSYKPSCFLCCRHPSAVFGPKLKDNDDLGAKPVIADEKILPELRCASCSNSLSSSPIFIAPDGSDICHRCGLNVHPSLVRNHPLETILTAFVFECTYKNYGCNNLYSFGAISVHEQNCEYFLAYHKYEMRKRESYMERSKQMAWEGNSIRESMRSPRQEKFIADIHNKFREIVSQPRLSELRRKDEEYYDRELNHQHEHGRNNQTRSFKEDQELAEHQRNEHYSRESSKTDDNKSNVSSESHDSRKTGESVESNKKQGEKVRGLIETPRGQIYATITPNNAILAFKPKKGSKPENLNMEHRDSFRGSESGGSTPNYGLETSFSFRQQNRKPLNEIEVRRNESMNGDPFYNKHLVNEMKARQKLNNATNHSRERY